MLATHTDGSFQNYLEETLDALSGLEGYLVELGTAEGTVKLATSGANAIGVLTKKNVGNTHVQVTALGSGVTCKVKAGGAIPKGSRVVWGTGGKLVVQPGTTGTYRTLGRYLGQVTAANNDIIEILMTVEPVTV